MLKKYFENDILTDISCYMGAVFAFCGRNDFQEMSLKMYFFKKKKLRDEMKLILHPLHSIFFIFIHDLELNRSLLDPGPLLD